MTAHSHYDKEQGVSYLHDHPVHGGEHLHHKEDPLTVNYQYQELSKLIAKADDEARTARLACNKAELEAKLLREVRHAILR